MRVPTIFILIRRFKVAGIDNYIILPITKLPKALQSHVKKLDHIFLLELPKPRVIGGF